MGDLSVVAPREEAVALTMPTILRWQGHRFYFFSNESFEPAHIHVDRAGNTAKFWLDEVALARNIGFSSRDLRVIENKVQKEREMFIRCWHEHFGSHS
jgi:hypothetical protein